MQSRQFEKQLTTIDSVKTSVRYISQNVDNSKIEAFIDESQQLDIKNVLGDALYIDLMMYVNKGPNDPVNTYYDNLLSGGIYEYCNCTYEFVGLIKALDYFVYARIVKHGDGVVTRYGFVNKQDPNSIRPDFKEKLAEYSDAFRIAEEYTNGCIRYISHNNNHFPKWKKHDIKPRRGPVFVKIGK